MSESMSFIPKVLGECHHRNYSINPNSKYFLFSVTFNEIIRRNNSIADSFPSENATGQQNYCFPFILHEALGSDQ